MAVNTVKHIGVTGKRTNISKTITSAQYTAGRRIATNNIGEWAAIVDALQWVKGHKKLVIWSDSKIAIGWVKGRTIGTNIEGDYPHLWTPQLKSFINQRLNFLIIYIKVLELSDSIPNL